MPISGVGSNSLTFDSNGNMTTDETGRQFVYDAWNRLVVVKDSGGATLRTFGYDGTGWRVTETVGSTTRDLYYSAGWQVVEETVTTGSTTLLNTRYVWGQGYVDDLVYRQRDTNSDGVLDERLWATHDANFNITSLADDAGWVVERYAYDAFGVRTVMDAGWNVLGASAYGFVHGFQGLRFDEVAGLSDARNRWYSPTLGRFVTNDPMGYSAGDVNLYRFVGNSPWMGVDPSGLIPWPKDEGSIEVQMSANVKMTVDTVGFAYSPPKVFVDKTSSITNVLVYAYSKVLKVDQDDVKFGKCTCTLYEQAFFRSTFSINITRTEESTDKIDAISKTFDVASLFVPGKLIVKAGKFAFTEETTARWGNLERQYKVTRTQNQSPWLPAYLIAYWKCTADRPKGMALGYIVFTDGGKKYFETKDEAAKLLSDKGEVFLGFGLDQ